MRQFQNNYSAVACSITLTRPFVTHLCAAFFVPLPRICLSRCCAFSPCVLFHACALLSALLCWRTPDCLSPLLHPCSCARCTPHPPCASIATIPQDCCLKQRCRSASFESSGALRRSRIRMQLPSIPISRRISVRQCKGTRMKVRRSDTKLLKLISSLVNYLLHLPCSLCLFHFSPLLVSLIIFHLQALTAWTVWKC
jgi:hypothetical protein